MSIAPTSSKRPITSWAWFGVWALIGAGAALGTISLGPLVLIPTAVAALLASKPAIRRSAFGMISGAGALLLYVAYVQRAGPGTTCWQRGAVFGCDQHLNPIPWLVLGLTCLIGGVIGQVKHAA